MARKTLLSEGEIRQFMKLANLTPLGHGRLEEMGAGAFIEEEEEMEVDMDMGPEEAPMDDMGDEEAPMDDMGDDEMGDMDAGGGTISIEDFMSALEAALEEVTGEPVSAEVDDDMGDDEMAMDAEPEMDMDGAPEMGMGDEEEEEPGMRDMYEGTTDEDIVNEVAKRVAARLADSNKKEVLASQLAERIFNKLTSK